LVFAIFVAAAIPLSLAAFHTAFNTINVCLILPFVPLLVKTATYAIKDKDGDSDAEKLQFITNGNLTPELNTDAVQKETAHFGDVIGRMNGFLKVSLNTINSKEKDEAIKRLFKYEEISDMMEIEITEYITNLSDKEVTSDTSTNIRAKN